MSDFNSNAVFLVGPMGAGKSTIGKMLASELGLDFIDIDKEIEDRCGADIAWIFDVEGEEGFRTRETNVLADLASRQGAVIATGGGIVMKEKNRDILQAKGTVVYLETSVEVQVERTSKDRKRPLLQNDNPAAVLQSLMSIRDPLYRSVSDVIVSTNLNSPRLVVKEITDAVQSA